MCFPPEFTAKVRGEAAPPPGGEVVSTKTDEEGNTTTLRSGGAEEVEPEVPRSNPTQNQIRM